MVFDAPARCEPADGTGVNQNRVNQNRVNQNRVNQNRVNQNGVNQTARTFCASSPFRPGPTSNSTAWPSSRVR
jgi:hypothetical protein